MASVNKKIDEKLDGIVKSNNNQPDNDTPEVLVENLYKKNIELLVKNKTLSLLSKLYEISILTLEPKDLAARISQTVQIDLDFELVGIFIFNEKSDLLSPLAISKSEKLKETFSALGLVLDNVNIGNVSSRKFFSEVVCQKKANMTNNLQEVWSDIIEQSKLEVFASESNIKTTLLHPLMVENRVLGSIMLSLNRNFETLSTFEKESIESFVNVIAVALEKSFLYEELQNANKKLRELDRQKDELLGLVSHQLATPVSAIKWNVEMMLDGDLGKFNKEQEDSINSLQSIAEDLSDLISMILDVSRIQLGRIKIDKQELDLEIFFKEILEIIKPKVTDRKIKFNVVLPQKFPKAMLDKRYTHMTIENLLTNAVKYTPENGSVDFNVEVRDNILYCQVKDTGVGIPKADQDKIFGKLFRASNVKNTVDGNGFGLYVAKGAIEAQGGKIWFESTEGKGTTFFVELPLNSSEGTSKEEPKKS